MPLKGRHTLEEALLGAPVSDVSSLLDEVSSEAPPQNHGPRTRPVALLNQLLCSWKAAT